MTKTTVEIAIRHYGHRGEERIEETFCVRVGSPLMALTDVMDVVDESRPSDSRMDCYHDVDGSLARVVIRVDRDHRGRDDRTSWFVIATEIPSHLNPYDHLSARDRLTLDRQKIVEGDARDLFEDALERFLPRIREVWSAKAEAA